MKGSGERNSRGAWGAAVCVMIGALALAGCLAEGEHADAVDSTCVGAARPPAVPAGGPPADADTESPSEKDCTFVDAEGQPVCRLKSGRVCTTNDECASGVCKTIDVAPDPSDPYDLGFSYTGCE